MVKAQEYLDQNYPKEKRWSIEELDLSNKNLENELDLSDFLSLKETNVSGNPQLGEIIDNKEQRTIIRINAQGWLNWKYPQKEEVSKIEFDSREQVEGKLNIVDFPQLEKIDFWRPHDTKKTTADKLRAILPQPNLNWGFCSDNHVTSLEIFNCPNLEEIDCSNSPIKKLNIQGCSNLKSLVCFDNLITNLDLSDCPKIKKLECKNNFIANLDLSQNKELEELNIANNNFSKQDLSFLSHLVNLEKLYLGSNHDLGSEREKHGFYNHFYGSLETLKKLTKLKELGIVNTDINSGVEYLHNNVTVYHSSDIITNSKVKEIAWQLNLFNSKKVNNWKEVGFVLEEIKKWIKIGLTAYDYDFANYLKNQKKLSPQGINPEEISWNGKLRKEYNELSWKDIHRDFTPKLRKEWEDREFSYEQVKKWVRNENAFSTEIHPKLSPEESSLANYLQAKEITPQETYYHLDKLREEYNSLEKEEMGTKASVDVEIAKTSKTNNWKSIHPHFGEDLQKYWEQFGFNCHQTKELIDKGLEPYDFGFAYYLKIIECQIPQLLTSDLIKLKREYEEPNIWLALWYSSKRRKATPKLDLEWKFNKQLKGELIIEEWENLEELNCSKNNFPQITLNNLPKLKSFVAQNCKLSKLAINNCPSLQILDVSDNSLSNLDFLDYLEPKKLSSFAIHNNKFPAQDLSFLDKFRNLESVSLGSEFSSEWWDKRFYSSLKPLKNLTKLKWLNISRTNIDSGLEYLPDSLEVICCKDEETIASIGTTACRKIKEELKDYYLVEKYQYSFKAWKEHQFFWKSLAKNLQKVNPDIAKTNDVRNFLRQLNIFFNVRTNDFHGDLQGSLLRINKTFIETNFLLKLEIEEFIKKIKNQKGKIIKSCLFFPREKELLQKLIIVHSEYVKMKKQRLPVINYRDEKEKNYTELRSKLGDELMERVELILTDCDELITWELEIESRLNIKLNTDLLLPEEQKQLLQKSVNASIEIEALKKQIETYIEQQELKELIKEKIKKKSKWIEKLSLENIEKIHFFSTWFNSKCAIFVKKEKSLIRKTVYNLWIVTCKPILGEINCLKLAKEITPIKEKWEEIISYFKKALNSNYPAAEIHNDAYTTELPSLIQDYKNVVKRKLKLSPNANLDDYLQPYDIVWRKMAGTSAYHTAIYLGGGQVAHISGERKKDMGVRIDSWENFLKGENKVEIHHPFIPFKKPELIQKHIDIAIKSNYGWGNYHLLKNNCEHFATMCVYGLGISQQAKSKIGKADYFLQAIKESDEFFEELEKKTQIQPNPDWVSLHSSFSNASLKNHWINYFIFSEVKEWFNAIPDLNPAKDYEFILWLKETKGLTPEQVLNNSNHEQLRSEWQGYQKEQLQNNVEIPPKNN